MSKMRVPQFWNTFSCGWIWTCKIMECLFRWEAYICCCQFVSSSDITSSFCLHRYRHCHHLQCHCLCFCLCIALCVRIFFLSLFLSPFLLLSRNSLSSGSFSWFCIVLFRYVDCALFVWLNTHILGHDIEGNEKWTRCDSYPVHVNPLPYCLHLF